MTAIAMGQSFKPIWGVLENKTVQLMGSWAIGATGAVGAKTGGTGMVLTRSAQGIYTIQLVGSKGLSARVHDLLYINVNITSNDTDRLVAKVKTAVAATGLITFTTFKADGTVEDPPNGGSLSVLVLAKLSSAVR